MTIVFLNLLASPEIIHSDELDAQLHDPHQRSLLEHQILTSDLAPCYAPNEHEAPILLPAVSMSNLDEHNAVTKVNIEAFFQLLYYMANHVLQLGTTIPGTRTNKASTYSASSSSMTSLEPVCSSSTPSSSSSVYSLSHSTPSTALASDSRSVTLDGSPRAASSQNIDEKPEPLQRLFAILLAKYFELCRCKDGRIEDYLSRPLINSAFGLLPNDRADIIPGAIAEIGYFILLTVLENFRNDGKTPFLRGSTLVELLLRQIIIYFTLHSEYKKEPVKNLKIFYDWENNEIEDQLARISVIITSSVKIVSDDVINYPKIKHMLSYLLKINISEVAKIHAKNDVHTIMEKGEGLRKIQYRLAYFYFFYFILAAIPETLFLHISNAFNYDNSHFNKKASDTLSSILQSFWNELLPNYLDYLDETYDNAYTSQAESAAAITQSEMPLKAPSPILSSSTSRLFAISSAGSQKSSATTILCEEKAPKEGTPLMPGKSSLPIKVLDEEAEQQSNCWPFSCWR